MSEYLNNNININNFTYDIVNNLLNIYDKVMVLKIYVDANDEGLRDEYIDAAMKHNLRLINYQTQIDAGFDLFAPGNEYEEFDNFGLSLRFFGPNWPNRNTRVNKLDFKVKCSAQMITDNRKVFNTGYYMHPRSSLSKTPLRLANSTGIIDSGYRGNLIGMFDLVNLPDNLSDSREADYFGRKLDRYVQICAPGLVPIAVEIVDSVQFLGDETMRGGGGFGSTGR
jgi:dUTPase